LKGEKNMSLTSESMTPADIAAVTGNCGGNGMWGDGGAWWIIILFLFVFCGWGGNGWGNNGGAAGAADNYVLASDFATLQRQIDSSTASLERKSDAINSGLCDGFYAQNTTALTGFSNVNQNLCNGFAQAELSRANGQMNLMQQMNASNITAMQNANALQSQLAQNNYLVQTLKPAPVPSFPAGQLYGYMGGCCNPCNSCS
jgi:hypothetical protein